jgi:hypothetical protein
MAGYSSYSLRSVKKKFGLIEKSADVFDVNCPPLPPSAWLLEALQRGHQITHFNNEKSRSEFIVAPVLSEIAVLNRHQISFYTGENLDADKNNDLNGECDYLFSNVPGSSTVESPIICLTEAENQNLMTGMGQCVAQMLGAKIFNEKEGHPLPFIYGCVTTGEDWQFLKLENNFIFVHPKRFYINDLEHILGAFQYIVNQYIVL